MIFPVRPPFPQLVNAGWRFKNKKINLIFLEDITMDIFAKVAEVLADHTGRDASEMTPETTFESLGIDSLETVEMVMELEEELDAELELDQKVTTIGELVKFIEDKIG
jgi:acyl carrier protein